MTITKIFGDEPLVPEKKAKLSNYFTLENKAALYTYDFGDNWQVKVRLEKILPRKEGVEYPICTAGKRAAVPEDSGGIGGYEDMLEILKDPEHEEYEDTWNGWEKISIPNTLTQKTFLSELEKFPNLYMRH